MGLVSQRLSTSPLRQNEVRSFCAKQIGVGCSALEFSGIWAAELPKTQCLLGFEFSGICGAGLPKAK